LLCFFEVFVVFALFLEALTAILFLKGFPGGYIELPVLEAKPETNFCAFEPHFGHFAGLLDSLIGRISSNAFRHLGQKYS
jgi:hypothetical protein